MNKIFHAFLSEMTAIASISMDQSYKQEMTKMSNWLNETAHQIGLQHVQLLKTPNLPIFYADYLVTDQNKPTILIYCHYDVQPADQLDHWLTDPFLLTQKGEYYHGRGVADNKGEIALVFAVLEELIQTKKLGMNIKLIFEGEEEVGSAHIYPTLKAHQKLFKADAAIILDEVMLTPEQPALYTSLRGLTSLEVTLRAHEQDLHSGVYGGKAINPAQELSHILSKAKDPISKEIKIPGFYDQVKKIREVLLEAEYTYEELNTIRPTFEINGMWSGYTGEGSKTIIPATAHVKITSRIVANQQPQEIADKIKNWFLSHANDQLEITVSSMEANANPVFVDTDNPFIKSLSQVMINVFGNPPSFVMCGATIGAAGDIQAVYGIPLLMFGFPLPNCHMHSPNENIHIPTFEKGYQVLMEFLSNN